LGFDVKGRVETDEVMMRRMIPEVRRYNILLLGGAHCDRKRSQRKSAANLYDIYIRMNKSIAAMKINK
jgi:hypothetical protein